MFRRMTRERYLSDDELARFMRVVRERRHKNQPRDHALFALLANTGMRPAEARALTVADCHLEGRHPWVRVVRIPKKHGPAPLGHLILQRPVAAVVAKHAGTIADPAAKLFPFTKRQGARLFQYYGGKAGLTPRRKIYALRHTVGMRLWKHTHDLRLIQAIMGHTTLAATAGYQHISGEEIRSAYAACSGV
jgi:integrase